MMKKIVMSQERMMKVELSMMNQERMATKRSTLKAVKILQTAKERSPRRRSSLSSLTLIRTLHCSRTM